MNRTPVNSLFRCPLLPAMTSLCDDEVGLSSKVQRRLSRMKTKRWKWELFHNVGVACILVLSLWCTAVASEHNNIYASYATFNESVNFTHMVVDPRSGRVYVGATNWLYQFNSSLDMEAEVETGPVQDSIQCSPTDCSNLRKVATTNFNKVLVIDDEAGMLLVCGSVHQGACRRHSLTNISILEELIPVPVAANDENSSTYAFIGPGHYFGHLSRVFYVATTNSRLGPYRDMVPAVTSRSLDDGQGKLFNIIEKSFSTIARVDISSHLRDYYLVNYIYGFFSGDFVYFATVQRKSHLRALEEWGFVTRLARVCTSDAGYNTYTELTLQCLGEDGVDYNLLQDASLVASGSDLAETLQVPTGSDVLVGVFAQSAADHTSRPARKSALCVFSLAEIEQRFTENIHMCYNGSVVTRNMDYIAGSIKDCPEPGKGGNVFDFCKEALKVNGSVPITGFAALIDNNVTYSAITTTITAQHTVAFVGTKDGRLKKVLLSSREMAEEFEEVVVDPGNPITSDLHLDPTKKFVYVLSPYTVSKVVILQLRVIPLLAIDKHQIAETEDKRTLASNSQVSCRTTRAPYPWYNVTQLILRIDNATLTLPSPFIYTEDPSILRIYPLKSFVSGGRSVTVDGTYLSSIQQPWMAVFKDNFRLNKTLCTVHSHSQMVCPSPAITQEVERFLASQGKSVMEASDQLKFRIGFEMDEVKSVLELQKNFPTLHSDMTYVPDPQFSNFKKDGVKQYKGESLVIEGKDLLLATTESEVVVTVGTRTCNLTSLTMTQLVCLPPQDQPPVSDEQRTDTDLPLVVVHIGSNLQYDIGYLRYEVTKAYEFPTEAIWGITAGGGLLMVLSVVILIILRHKSSQAEQEYKRIQLQMDTLENSVRSECKQAFAELQTDMTDITNDLHASGIPTLDHRTFVMKVFFPGVCDHPLLQDKMMSNGFCSNYDVAMNHFQQLLLNKTFLILFITVLESQKTFTIRDRVNVASLLMIILMEKMDYAADVLKMLLGHLIDKSVTTKHPQLMLRRTESVVEKMLTNWMALNMYDYLKERAGRSLFLLFCAVKHQVEKGPIDAVTNDARYSLSEQRLLKDHIEYSTVTIHLLKDDQDEKIQTKVNDCDTIGQVKAKILDALYKNTPFSLRPSVYEVDLEWRHERGGHLTLADEDLTTKTSSGWKRLNTLRHYGVREFAVMSLVTKQNSFSSNSTGNASLSSVTPIINSTDVEQGVRYWHLVKPIDDHVGQQKDHSHKAIRPEIFLTRLLSTKGTVQKFVDDFLSTVLTVGDDFPPPIKWLFDLLDNMAVQHGITDPDVVHAWKSNSLPLRFWVNFIKNPDFILDINKTPLLDSCLSVIAQALMDACSTYEHRLGKDSPSNKLLFAKDILSYKKMVTKFYEEVALLPAITDQEISANMQRLSVEHHGEFDTMNAVKDLYIYVEKYIQEICEALKADPTCIQAHLAQKLEMVICALQGEETSLC
ncbi:plexin-B-like [Limulus polyphemus]|uniref:Plexin-B-like n=1 Tax=Limulus polyphemus TaxID=6850 RepID=A0ABM1S6Z5_LIMPO|nr:plexin-B-like [Limulus polyphemus]